MTPIHQVPQVTIQTPLMMAMLGARPQEKNSGITIEGQTLPIMQVRCSSQTIPTSVTFLKYDNQASQWAPGLFATLAFHIGPKTKILLPYNVTLDESGPEPVIVSELEGRVRVFWNQGSHKSSLQNPQNITVEQGLLSEKEQRLLIHNKRTPMAWIAGSESLIIPSPDSTNFKTTPETGVLQYVRFGSEIRTPF